MWASQSRVTSRRLVLGLTSTFFTCPLLSASFLRLSNSSLASLGTSRTLMGASILLGAGVVPRRHPGVIESEASGNAMRFTDRRGRSCRRAPGPGRPGIEAAVHRVDHLLDQLLGGADLGALEGEVEVVGPRSGRAPSRVTSRWPVVRLTSTFFTWLLFAKELVGSSPSARRRSWGPLARSSWVHPSFSARAWCPAVRE